MRHSWLKNYALSLQVPGTAILENVTGGAKVSSTLKRAHALVLLYTFTSISMHGG